VLRRRPPPPMPAATRVDLQAGMVMAGIVIVGMKTP